MPNTEQNDEIKDVNQEDQLRGLLREAERAYIKAQLGVIHWKSVSAILGIMVVGLMVALIVGE